MKIGFVQRSIVLSRLLLCPGDTGDMTDSVQSLVCHNTEERERVMRRRRQEMSAEM